MPRPKPALTLLVAACALAVAVHPAFAQTPAAAERATFVLAQGESELFTETFTRTADRLEAEITAPNGERASLVATLRPDATVSRLEVRQLTVPPGTAQASTVIELGGDSMTITAIQGIETETTRAPAIPGAIPFVNPSTTLMDQIVRRARVIGGDTVVVPLVAQAGSGGQAVDARVVFEPGRARIQLGAVEIVLDLDAQGRVTGGGVPLQGLTLIRREPPG